MYGSTPYGGAPLGEAVNGDSQTRTARAHVTPAVDGTARAAGSYRLPLPDSTAEYLFGLESLRTDHDVLSVSGVVSSDGLDLLASYLSSADVSRERTAYGAFRRVRRDGGDSVEVRPPAALTPPLDSRTVVPESVSTESITPQLARVDLDLGLVEPRPRDPLAGDGITERLADTTVAVAAGATETVTLSGTAPETAADYLAEATTPDDSDSTLVAVSDAAYTLAFPAATLRLSRQQVAETAQASEAGKSRRTLPVELAPGQAADLLAVGSRVEAAQIREVPDGPNRAVDTLPDGELTASVQTPDGIAYSGEFVLVEWSLERARPNGRYPYDAEIVLVDAA